MNQRIKAIRKSEGATQDEFAKRLNLSRNFIAQVEMGTKEFSERTISDVIREFNVNETWLRTGEGAMHPPQSRDDEIADIIKSASKHDPEKAAKFFQDLLRDMSEAEIVIMYEIFKKHFPEQQNRAIHNG